MEKRIELERRNRPVSQIDELNLDNCRSTTIEGLSDEFQNLKSLSLNGVGLTSLKGFPALQNLRKLEMGDNRIAGGLQVLKDCTRLVLLNLSNNKIKDLETIEPLKDLPALKSLDLYRNEITNVENYRRHVFELLPDLNYLDGTDVNNKEADESDVDGLEDEDCEEVPVNGKSDLDGEDSVKNDHDDCSSPDEDQDGAHLDGHDDGVGATEGDSNYESSISVVSPDGDEDGEEDDDEPQEQEEEDDEAHVYDDALNEDEEEEEEEEESGNLETLGLTDIYREDLSDCSDGGAYEEESDDDEDFDDGEVGDESLDTSNVIEEGEAEVPNEVDLADLSPPQGDDNLSGQKEHRGVKRPHADTEEGD